MKPCAHCPSPAVEGRAYCKPCRNARERVVREARGLLRRSDGFCPRCRASQRAKNQSYCWYCRRDRRSA